MPKAIFFDLDDTLISFDGASDHAWLDTCGMFSGKYGFADENTFLHCINETRAWYWGDPERFRAGRMDLQNARREIVRLALERLNYRNEEHVWEIAEHYRKSQYAKVCLFPESIETLDRLKEKGIRMAVITNGTSLEQRDKLDRFELLKYFELCLIEEEVGFGKPDTRVFEIALKHFGVKPEDVWMIGDNIEWDVAAPQKLGIYSIWNDYTKKGLTSGAGVKPDRIVNGVGELRELVG